jgi:hypothetical protein
VGRATCKVLDASNPLVANGRLRKWRAKGQKLFFIPSIHVGLNNLEYKATFPYPKAHEHFKRIIPAEMDPKIKVCANSASNELLLVAEIPRGLSLG